MTEQADGQLWCPRCLRGVGEAARCPSCGLPQLGADAARLRVVARRLSDIAEQQRVLSEEANTLRWEQGRLVQALAQGAGTQGGWAAPRAGHEWRPEMVRGVLLWLGSALVALAALIFAVVAWIRLGDAGRAGLLGGVTLLAALGTLAARRRLPATAEALGGLTLALVLVDWYAARRAGMAAGWSDSAWWALGTATSAGVAAVAGRWLWVQRLGAAVLAQVSAVLVVATITDRPWTAGVGLALVAAAGVAAATTLADAGSWRAAALVVGVGAGLLELGALGLALQLLPVEDAAGAVRLAAVFAAMALAPAVARAGLHLPLGRVVLDGLVALSVAALLASAGALLAGYWSSWALLAGLAVLGAAAVTLARALPPALERGAAVAAAAVLAVGVVGLVEPLLGALVAPLGWVVDAPWTARLGSEAAVAVERLALAQGGLDGLGPVVVMLLACGAAAGAAAARVRGVRLIAPWPTAMVAALGAATGVLAVLPLAAGWPLWAALGSVAAGALAAAAAAVLADRAGRDPAAGALAACAGVLLVLAVGWALASEAGTLALAAVLIAAGALVAGVARGAWLRCCGAAVASAAVVGESAAIVASAGAATAPVGLAVAVAAAAVLVAGALWRRRGVEGPVLEGVGVIGLVLGVLLAGPEQRWLAITLTATVPLLLAAGARPDRRAYAWSAAAGAVAATWAWLSLAGVTLPEAYTLPAAAVALVAGALARRRAPQLSSWLAFGPGLAAALLPSLGLVIDQDGVARPLLLTAGALLVVLVGARARLQAPLVLGAVTLVVLGVDAVWPVAAQLPRWATIGAAGLLLLWLGATAERRLGQLRELRQRLQGLEHHGTAEAPH